MNKKILENLNKIKKSFNNPFPYSDTEKIQKDFKEQFNKINEFSFNADFNQFCMQIAGVLSYLSNGNEKDISKKQLDQLNNNFFETFSRYNFLQEEIKNYPNLYKEYVNYEKVRILLLEYFKIN